MRFLHEYIEQFRSSTIVAQNELASIFEGLKRTYDIFQGGNPPQVFGEFVSLYNWLGLRDVKDKYNISQNLARNLPGSLMQDYLLHLTISLCKGYPALEVFTEVRVLFGNYPIWSKGQVDFRNPSEKSDIAVGYIIEDGAHIISRESWPKQPHYKLDRGRSILPLVTINSKIRVSQSEFFDWYGREQLMTKGNPHCLSIQVALRKEMDISIVEASQARDKFFLLGEGTETNVAPRDGELDRLIETISDHLEERMLDSTL
jgi:hypothetical protein